MSDPGSLPRGIRNNNPGNLRPGPAWQGIAGVDQDQPDPPYLQFIDPAHGIRAIAKTLQAYEDVHGIHTLEGVFQRWAPSGDNNPTSAYAANVAAALGVAVTDPVDLHDQATLAAITAAIIHQENGASDPPWYDEATVKAGVALAFPTES